MRTCCGSLAARADPRYSTSYQSKDVWPSHLEQPVARWHRLRLWWPKCSLLDSWRTGLEEWHCWQLGKGDGAVTAPAGDSEGCRKGWWLEVWEGQGLDPWVQGCGIVEFSTAEEAAEAINQLHLSEVNPSKYRPPEAYDF